MNEFVRLEEEGKRRRPGPHARCQQQIAQYGRQIQQIQALLSGMRDDLRVVIEQTIQCLRDANLVQSVYQDGRASLSNRDRELLVAAMQRQPVLVQALVRMGDFKAGGLGVSRQISTLKQEEDGGAE